MFKTLSLFDCNFNSQLPSTLLRLRSEMITNILCISPMDVIDFHNIIARSYLVLTDSGGIQEEAPALGKPVLVMRDTTERPEGVTAGTLRLVGTREEDICRSFAELLTDSEVYRKMSHASNPYEDGFASRRIADVLLKT